MRSMYISLFLSNDGVVGSLLTRLIRRPPGPRMGLTRGRNSDNHFGRSVRGFMRLLGGMCSLFITSDLVPGRKMNEVSSPGIRVEGLKSCIEQALKHKRNEVARRASLLPWCTLCRAQ